MLMNERLINLQNLLYAWLSKFEKRSLENIKVHCNFLNDSYKLNLPHPEWSIFWPLVYNGLVDYIGKGYYALTAPIIIDYGFHFIYVNHRPNSLKIKKLALGIYMSDSLENYKNYSIIKVNPLSILKRFPTVKDVVDSFPESLRDEKDLKYYNRNANKGLAKLKSEGFVRYFSIPDELYIRELPDRTINPEAFSIAYCYSRAINKESNGIYKEESKLLILPLFAFPCLLYRSLLLYSLSKGIMPEVNERYYYFRNMSKSCVKQLNRILCNSITYE